MTSKIDQQIDRMIRDLKILASILLCPGNKYTMKKKPLNVIAKYSEYEFEKELPTKERELIELYALRDKEFLSPFEVQKYIEDEQKENECKSSMICGIIEYFSDNCLFYEIDGDGWGLDKINKRYKSISDFSDFIAKRFSCVLNLDITKIKPGLSNSPFDQLIKKESKPVYYQTIWECHSLLTEHRDEIKEKIRNFKNKQDAQEKGGKVELAETRTPADEWKPRNGWRLFQSLRYLAESEEGFNNKTTGENIKYHLGKGHLVWTSNIKNAGGKFYLFVPNKSKIIESLQTEKRRVKQGKQKNK